MMMNRSAWTIVTTLCLAAACGPSVGGLGTEGDSESEDSGTTGSSTTNPNPTNPNPTQPDPDTGVGTGDVTGTPTTGPDTTGPDDTTGGESDSCCEAHASPSCNEPDVVDCVCEREAFCCAFEWDQTCVDLAQIMCDATCNEPGSTGDPDTGMGGEACAELVTFELLPSDATHTGAWELGMSMVGEGEISVLDQMGGNTEGSILFEPDIPCNDTWYIWARTWQSGNDDSYYATLDGEPMPAAIFEGDCGPGGQGYDWTPLNWRDEGDPPCTYMEDPWAPDWAAGVHQIEFTFRESLAMGRILLTNDQDLIPPR